MEGRKACKKRDLLSLIRAISHASKAVRAGRMFVRRLIDLSTVVKHLDYYVHISLSSKAVPFRIFMEWHINDDSG